jgi:elongation factor G
LETEKAKRLFNRRRIKVSGIASKATGRIRKAVVPMSEMLDFEPTLTSITGGRGSFVMVDSHMDEVPAHLQQKIIAEAVKEGRVHQEEE